MGRKGFLPTLDMAGLKQTLPTVKIVSLANTPKIPYYTSL
jgi:hypothetical protein